MNNDLISRQTVLDVLKDKWNLFSDANDAMQESVDTIESLRPVSSSEKPNKCEDAISRQAVLELLDFYYGQNQQHFTVENLKDEIENMPSVSGSENPNKWIPADKPPKVSEEGFSDYVLMSFSNFSIPAIGLYWSGDGWHEGDDDRSLESYGLHVNAWMPLPEPYKVESVG